MTTNMQRRAFSFVEIIVALSVSIVFFGGLIYFASSTRVETSKAGIICALCR